MIAVTKIRPVSWKIFVQGLENTQYVRRVLEGSNMHTTQPEQQPELVDPPLFAFQVVPNLATPLTTEELEAILQRDERIKLDFDEQG